MGVVASGFAAVGPALADATTSLNSLSVDATIAASSADPTASAALSQLGDGDATPLIAGLAVGIAVVGTGIKALTDEKSAVTKVIAAHCQLMPESAGIPMSVPNHCNLTVHNADPACARAPTESASAQAHTPEAEQQAVRVQGASPANALQLLQSDKDAIILDIRSKSEVREQGQPDLKGTKKSLVSIPYSPPAGPTAASGATGTVSVGWAERIARMKKVRSADAPCPRRRRACRHVKTRAQ